MNIVIYIFLCIISCNFLTYSDENSDNLSVVMSIIDEINRNNLSSDMFENAESWQTTLLSFYGGEEDVEIFEAALKLLTTEDDVPAFARATALMFLTEHSSSLDRIKFECLSDNMCWGYKLPDEWLSEVVKNGDTMLLQEYWYKVLKNWAFVTNSNHYLEIIILFVYLLQNDMGHWLEEYLADQAENNHPDVWQFLLSLKDIGDYSWL